MKFCPNCGTQVNDDAVFCPNCGASVGADGNAQTVNQTQPAKESTMTTLAKVFMIIGTIFNGFSVLPLAWCIPMTVHYFKAVKNGQPVGTGFKVCSLLFVSLLGGIFMLCDKQ